jgi:all-trans-retinol dehydrogenase (NAD+)
MTQFKSKTVLVTGGASGIGYLMGKMALEEGADTLIIWDIHVEAMQRAKDSLQQKTCQVHSFRVDVADAESVQKAVEQCIADGLLPDILILNAGVVSGKYFHEHLPGEIEKTIGVNVLGCMLVTHAFLPVIMANGHGHIVVIASAAGMLSNPRMAAYAGSKWAVLGWAESLRIEMQQLKTGVHVTTVTPSYIDTGMFAGARVNPLLPNLSPETAARKIIKGIKQNSIFVRMPALVYLLPIIKGLLPTKWFDLFVGRWLGVYKSMDHFSGRG